ncbi:hypothetical protein K461DRAFT_82497 [Myriangium duriaei CBS 260.36]|uniref:Uncharacterized protein n=1 Tax=Myriangium duriaei CBS 260.36 TaxID=1168546 RepID=A0A9P4J6M8_9PEZI|nr:hypothetical protein K461DRAFT_82497 [Myriangium duriaei CBS 260.36]
MESPPLSPLPHFTPTKTSSPQSLRRPISRRSSSFSSIKSISADRRRSSYSDRRLSNASRYSNGYDELDSPTNARHRTASGMATLADELDSADDEDWEQEEESALDEVNAPNSGVDVAYDKSLVRPKGNNQKSTTAQQPRTVSVTIENDFSRELEQSIKEVANFALASLQPQADTLARTMSALRDLTAQTDIETSSQRLATSMNSVSAYLNSHIRTIQSGASTIFSPIASQPDEDETIELLALQTALQQALPVPDPAPSQQLARLTRDTSELQLALSGLLDSIQLARQLSISVARALKVTSAMVVDLRREAERADEAATYLEHGEWDTKLADRYCAGQCYDIMSGFEGVCESLRAEIEGAAQA